MDDLLSYLDFKDGLLDVVIQDKKSGRVLMLAHMNKDAFVKTYKEGKVYFWSRSREELWKKGESSSHTQEVEEMRIDCDGDALLVVVDQKGGACHTGHFSCFYRKIIDGELEVVEEKVFDPENVYGE
ncbi:phosphoribosyl-AMP cyclohydrolase [archaeon SCG-AAA382B04]|nr:phosphoribosyl-AMP cyclohydrolase [archaeon SCG-AAA382B04]